MNGQKTSELLFLFTDANAYTLLTLIPN